MPEIDLTVPLATRAHPAPTLEPPAAGAPWRSLTPADIPALLALIHDAEEADGSPYRTTAAELEEIFDESVPHIGVASVDTDGSLVAFGFVRLRSVVQNVLQAVCSGAVRPDCRDQRIGTHLVAWQTEAARHLLANSSHEGPAQIVHIVDEPHAAMADILEQRGFTARRSFSQMRRDLTLPFPEEQLARHITIEPWDEVWSDSVRRAQNAALSEMGMGEGLTPEQWAREIADIVPAWSFVAVDRSSDRAKVAGFVLSARYEEDWPVLGWREGYIDAFSVLGPWRRQGIGLALLAHAMREFAADGMEYAGIDVDWGDELNWAGLYEELSFEQTFSSTEWALDV